MPMQTGTRAPPTTRTIQETGHSSDSCSFVAHVFFLLVIAPSLLCYTDVPVVSDEPELRGTHCAVSWHTNFNRTAVRRASLPCEPEPFKRPCAQLDVFSTYGLLRLTLLALFAGARSVPVPWSPKARSWKRGDRLPRERWCLRDASCPRMSCGRATLPSKDTCSLPGKNMLTLRERERDADNWKESEQSGEV